MLCKILRFPAFNFPLDLPSTDPDPIGRYLQTYTKVRHFTRLVHG